MQTRIKRIRILAIAFLFVLLLAFLIAFLRFTNAGFRYRFDLLFNRASRHIAYITEPAGDRTQYELPLPPHTAFAFRYSDTGADYCTTLDPDAFYAFYTANSYEVKGDQIRNSDGILFTVGFNDDLTGNNYSFVNIDLVMDSQKAGGAIEPQPVETSDASVVSGQIPRLSADEFRLVMEEKLTFINSGKYNDVESLFADYNGEKIQIIPGENQSPAANDFLCFYRGESEESVDEIVLHMFSGILDTLTQDSDDRSFIVLKYEIPDQKIQSSEEVETAILAHAEELRQNGSMDTFSDIESFIQYCITDAQITEGLVPIADGMYEITGFHGYYKFEGTDMVPFETEYELAKSSGTLTGDGMIPFIAQGSTDTFTYILMENDGVYRLQRANAFLK